MAHLVQNPGLAELVSGTDELADSEIPGLDLFLYLVDFCRKRPNMSTAQLLELLREHPAQSHLRKLAIWQLPGDAERQGLEFQDAVTGIWLQWIDTRLSHMPKIVDQDNSQREEFLALQRRATALKGDLQGRVE